MSDQPCPRCDTPLPDTAYVCGRCAGQLAVVLRNAAANWDELEAAVARQTAISGDSGAVGKRLLLEGPVCEHCHHDSCLPINKARKRVRWTEDPIPGETHHVSFGAMEHAWDVTNTATTWARVIEEESGRPIPPPTYREGDRAEPRRITVHRTSEQVTPSPNAAWCDYSWLPLETCACGNPNAKHPTKEPA